MRLARRDALVSVLAHAIAFAAIYLLAFAIRFDGAVPVELRDSMLGALIPVVGLKLGAFLAMGCHRSRWHSATFVELTGLAEAAAVGSVLAVSCLLLGAGPSIPRSVLLIDWIGATMGICGARLAGRLFRERYRPLLASRRLRRVVVVGAESAGEAVVRAIGARPHLGLKVIGILDADRAMHGRTLAGVPVLGGPADLARIAARHRPEVALIPTPATPAGGVRSLVDACHIAGVKAQIVPGLDAILSGTVVVSPRDVDIRDLLGREPVRLEGREIGELLEGRVVLITGAAGSIGSEICRQVLAFRPAKLVLLDNSENGLFFLDRDLAPHARATRLVTCIASITDARRIRAVFTAQRPDVVFHAAAHKHVPLVESNPGEAVKNNVLGTRTVADEAIRARADAFVLISTDKAVNPTSVMGACKRLAEGYVKALSGLSATRMITVRFGNVLGSSGSVVPIFQEQIRRGGPVTVTHPEMTRYFMTITEAAQLVLQAAAMGRGGETFVLDMGEPVQVLDLARDMIRLSGLAEGRDIVIVFTGLRPGEKLAEELADETEDLLPTPHAKIRALRHRPASLERLQAGLERLAAAMDAPADEVIDVLRELLPSYRSGHPEAPPRCNAAAYGPVEGPTVSGFVRGELRTETGVYS